MPAKNKHEPMSHEHAAHLLHPLRWLFLSSKKLADRLDLQKNFRVLELGPGPGYFSIEVARRVPAGTLVLLDIQQEMLDMAKERLDKKGLFNVEYIKGDAQSLNAAQESFDVAFLVAVLGEVPDQSQCLKEIFRVLRPHGLLSITEQPHDPDRIPQPEIRRLAEEQGFASFEKNFGRGKILRSIFANPKPPDHISLSMVRHAHQKALPIGCQITILESIT